MISDEGAAIWRMRRGERDGISGMRGRVEVYFRCPS